MEQEIRVIIADDDDGMRLIERKMIERVDGFTLVGEACDGDEAVQLFDEHHPHVVFLDVEMPGRTGIECAKHIQDKDPRAVIIFATAHDCYMGDAFQVYAFDYLVKPFKLERVMQTLERARDRLLRVNEPEPDVRAARLQRNVSDGRLMLRGRDGVNFVRMADILLVQREERTTVIYTRGGGRFTTGENLGDTEARLDPSVFFRCHKSYIINLNFITAITPYGRWTYVVKLEGTEHDALITHEKYEELEKMFG